MFKSLELSCGPPLPVEGLLKLLSEEEHILFQSLASELFLRYEGLSSHEFGSNAEDLQ